MSEHDRMTERYLFSRRGAAIECTVSTDRMSDCPKIDSCYNRALSAFLKWLEEERLSALVAESSAERASGKCNRLHQTPEQWYFTLARHTIGTFWSVCLTVTGKGDSYEQRYCQRRVWDSERSILCPLSCFISPRQARKYEKWEYSLEKDGLTVCRKGKINKIVIQNLVKK